MISCGEHRCPVENTDILWRSLVYPVENISCGGYPVDNIWLSCGEHCSPQDTPTAVLHRRYSMYPLLVPISCGCYPVDNDMISCGGGILWMISCGEHSDILFSTGYTHSRSPQEILNVSTTGTHGVILWRTT